jgi:hypothetical protein
MLISEVEQKTAKARTIGMTQRVYDELTRLWEQSPKDLDETRIWR